MWNMKEKNHRTNTRLLYYCLTDTRCSSVSIVTRLRCGRQVFNSRQGNEVIFFLFHTASGTALGPTQPPIQWVPRDFCRRIKRPDRQADHSPPSSAEIKNAWSYNSTDPYVFLAWCLVKYRPVAQTTSCDIWKWSTNSRSNVWDSENVWPTATVP